MNTNILKVAAVYKEASYWNSVVNEIKAGKDPLKKLAQLMRDRRFRAFVDDYKAYIEMGSEGTLFDAVKPDGSKLFGGKKWFINETKRRFGLSGISIVPPQTFTTDFFKDFLLHFDQYEKVSELDDATQQYVWGKVFPMEPGNLKNQELSKYAPEDMSIVTPEDYLNDIGSYLNKDDLRTYENEVSEDPIMVKWLSSVRYTSSETPLRKVYFYYLYSGMFPLILTKTQQDMEAATNAFIENPPSVDPWFKIQPEDDNTTIEKKKRSIKRLKSAIKSLENPSIRVVDTLSIKFYDPPYPVMVPGEKDPSYIVSIPTDKAMVTEGVETQCCLKNQFYDQLSSKDGLVKVKDQREMSGVVQILSLRDKNNKPQVSIELNRVWDEPKLSQIRSKSNTRPSTGLMTAVREWMQDKEIQIASFGEKYEYLLNHVDKSLYELLDTLEESCDQGKPDMIALRGIRDALMKINFAAKNEECKNVLKYMDKYGNGLYALPVVLSSALKGHLDPSEANSVAGAKAVYQEYGDIINRLIAKARTKDYWNQIEPALATMLGDIPKNQRFTGLTGITQQSDTDFLMSLLSMSHQQITAQVTERLNSDTPEQAVSLATSLAHVILANPEHTEKWERVMSVLGRNQNTAAGNLLRQYMYALNRCEEEIADAENHEGDNVPEGIAIGYRDGVEAVDDIWK